MYPRFEESSVDPMSRRVGARAGLSGFVAYMKRSDAERAVHDMDGLDWGGNILKVGWSKSVPIPARPIYGKSSAALLGLVPDCSDPTTRSHRYHQQLVSRSFAFEVTFAAREAPTLRFPSQA